MRKNVLMGVFALLFAAGAAFATSSKITQDVYYWEDQANEENCISFTTTVLCEEGPQDCTDLNTPDGPRRLYGSEDCEVQLKLEQGF